MKIKSLAAICKRRKNIVLFHDGSDQQYISDGNAVYPVFGLPELNTDYVLTIFDVPEKDRDKYITRETTLPDGINLSDDDYSERAVISIPISIAYGGTPLRPLKTTGGIVYIDSRYLSPLADMLDVLELYERRTTAGARDTPVFAFVQPRTRGSGPLRRQPGRRPSLVPDRQVSRLIALTRRPPSQSPSGLDAARESR